MYKTSNALTATRALAASAWQPVGSPDFTSMKPAGESLFVYNGTLYVAFTDVARFESLLGRQRKPKLRNHMRAFFVQSDAAAFLDATHFKVRQDWSRQRRTPESHEQSDNNS